MYNVFTRNILITWRLCFTAAPYLLSLQVRYDSYSRLNVFFKAMTIKLKLILQVEKRILYL